MPEIARFYGMVIKMFFITKEHNPPHIHVLYGDYMGAIDIRTGEILEGDLPRRAYQYVKEWIDLHQKSFCSLPIFKNVRNNALYLPF